MHWPSGFWSVISSERRVSEKAIGSAEQRASNIILDAENQAETIKKEITIEAKEEAHRMRSDVEREVRDRRNEMNRLEKRLISKEESIDKKLENIERKEESITNTEHRLAAKEAELDGFIEKQLHELERVSGYTAEEAKAILLSNLEKEIRHDASVMIKEIETKAKDEADKKAKEIITGAIQRCAADQVAESTVSVVNLPNDEMDREESSDGKEETSVRSNRLPESISSSTTRRKQLYFPDLTRFAGKWRESASRS